jgi:hypothetical protein
MVMTDRNRAALATARNTIPIAVISLTIFQSVRGELRSNVGLPTEPLSYCLRVLVQDGGESRGIHRYETAVEEHLDPLLFTQRSWSLWPVDDSARQALLKPCLGINPRRIVVKDAADRTLSIPRPPVADFRES